MKKVLSLSIALCAIFGFALDGQTEVMARGYYEGGEKVFDFSNAESIYENFNIYSEEEGQGFYATDGYLCSIGRAETKAILKSPSTLSKYSMEADFYPSFAAGGLDVGFYIHASGAGNRIDDIKAYNINLEKPSFSNQLTVKIHSFNHSYAGELTANSTTIKACPVNLRVDVNENNVKAYVNHSKNPIIDYSFTSWEPGSVGFRAFSLCPSYLLIPPFLLCAVPLVFIHWNITDTLRVPNIQINGIYLSKFHVQRLTKLHVKVHICL